MTRNLESQQIGAWRLPLDVDLLFTVASERQVDRSVVMRCILCKMCEPAKAALEKKWLAWVDTQTNSTEIWERETEQHRLQHACDLLETDPAQYFKEHLALAESGSIWSALCIGAAFEQGIGIAPDPAQAEGWYRRACEGGSDDALLRLGALYMRSQRCAEAEAVYRSGLERNLVPTMHALALAYYSSSEWRSRREEAHALLKRASAAGDILAERFLVAATMRGRFGLRHVPEGFRLALRLADEIAELLKDEEFAVPDNPLTGLAGYLTRLCPFLAGRIAAPAGVVV